MRESFNARLELDQVAWLLNIRCIDCGLFIEIADASKQPLCFVTTCIKKDNIHGQIKGAYSLIHFLIALLTTCLKMNMGVFQKLDFVCKGYEARRGFWLSKMYEKEAPMENHHMPKLSVERGRSSLATRNQIFLFIWRSYSLPPQKVIHPTLLSMQIWSDDDNHKQHFLEKAIHRLPVSEGQKRWR